MDRTHMNEIRSNDTTSLFKTYAKMNLYEELKAHRFNYDVISDAEVCLNFVCECNTIISDLYTQSDSRCTEALPTLAKVVSSTSHMENIFTTLFILYDEVEDTPYNGEVITYVRIAITLTKELDAALKEAGFGSSIEAALCNVSLDYVHVRRLSSLCFLVYSLYSCVHDMIDNKGVCSDCFEYEEKCSTSLF